MPHVLVVDDEPGVRSFVATALRRAGFEIDEATDTESALRTLRRRSYAVIVTDLRMPGADGMALLDHARKDHPDTEVIVLTAHGTVTAAVDAMKRGAFDFLQKPVDSPDALRAVVRRAVERHGLRAQAEIARGSTPTLTWGAAAMIPVVSALQKVARTHATVLLLGESGVGKEVAAKALHSSSDRADKPFVAVNCASLSASLLESELFGHERGAFTGAVQRRRGKLELADGGTFFLDEVGELDPGLQARLLRVLQERRFERVGGEQTVEVDVRIVAATNRDLEARVRDGTFREDLYYRLAGFPIRLPPLRERSADVLPLARTLLSRIGHELGRPGLYLSEASASLIPTMSWPGNVRELYNHLERAAILSDGPEITLVAAAARHAAPDVVPTLAQAEAELIRRALALHDGNRRKSADHLGIGERTLYEKIKLYGLI
jgi:two-component system response regulator AtoC